MALSVGSPAPDFTLKTKTADGLRDVRLGDHRGQRSVVLLFFPLAFTGVCTAEMCSVRDALREYEALDAAVYGISVDSPFALEAFAKQQGLNFPLLSDFNREVAQAYDVLYTDFIGLRGVAKRAAFVVGKDGVIRFASSSDDPKVLPDFAAVQAALRG